MSKHLKLHSFTGSTDHDFTGLVSGQTLQFDGVNIVSSGAAASGQSLSQTLVLGNTTGANDIEVDSSQKITFNASGTLRVMDGLANGSPLTGFQYYLTGDFTSEIFVGALVKMTGTFGGVNDGVFTISEVSFSSGKTYFKWVGIVTEFNTPVGNVTTGISQGSLNLDYSLTGRTWTMPDASGIVALTSDSSGNTLSSVLTNGNTTNDGQTIDALNDGGQLDLRYNGWTASDVILSTDSGGWFTEAQVLLSTTETELSNLADNGGLSLKSGPSGYTYIEGAAVTVSSKANIVSNPGADGVGEILMSDKNLIEAITFNDFASEYNLRPVALSSRNVIVNQSVHNTVLAGGSGYTAAESNSLYTQNARLAENGGVIYSAGTDLYSIFLTSVTPGDITRVQGGTNITTGGTANEPIINLDADIVLTSVNAITLSGGTIFSGNTDLYDIFFDGSGTTKTVPVFTDSNTIGDSTLTISGLGDDTLTFTKAGGAKFVVDNGTQTLVILNNIIQYNTGTYSGELDFNNGITGNRSWDLPDASGIIALTTDITGYSGNTLSEVLTNGNTTNNGQTIDALNGNSRLDLRNGSDSTILLDVNNGGYDKAQLYLSDGYVELSDYSTAGGVNLFADKISLISGSGSAPSNADFVSIQDYKAAGSIYIGAAGQFDVIKINGTQGVANATSAAEKKGVIVSARNSYFGASVFNSVIAGGVNINAAQNDSLYTQNARLAENGGTIYSGGTDLYDIFSTSSGETLAQTLALGNITSGNDITITNGDKINLGAGDASIYWESGVADFVGMTNDGDGYLFGDSINVPLGAGSYIDGSSIGFLQADANYTYLRHTPSTGTNIQTLQNATGTIALLSDVVSGDFLPLSGGQVYGAVDFSGTTQAQFGSTANIGLTATGFKINGDVYNINLYTDGVIELASNGGDIAFTRNTGGNAGSHLFSAYTADRSYYWRDMDGTVAFLSDITGVSGSGTDNTIPLWNGTTGIDDSIITQQGISGVTINGNLTATGDTQGATVTATEFFAMSPYTDGSPASPSDNDVWFHSGATGTITLKYRVGGTTTSVELSV